MENTATYDMQAKSLICQGEWNLSSLPFLKATLENISWPKSGEVTIQGKSISNMDVAGAWLLNSRIKQLENSGLKIKLENFTTAYQSLISIVKERAVDESQIPKRKKFSWLSILGKNSLDILEELHQYLNFIGKLTLEAIRVTFNPAHFRTNEIAGVILRSGYQALPILGLLSFMIGIVITYQMGIQLRTYGANIFIVDLLGLSVLREFGPLLTAIMVAGRTGSSFTAQIGIMKINQEIDALDTMGVTPGELLVLPRIAALFFVMPLLTIWSDIFGIIGGMMMARNLLDLTWYDFLIRFQHEIPLRALFIGLGKAPVFALIIASIGCFQGMRVRGSADSVGKNTTRSVVLGIFFIIVADAIFSVIFSKLKL